MVTLIYRFPFSNYLREEIDERFDLLDLNRFGGLPGGGPGAPFETRGRLLGDWFAGIARGGCILVFSVWGWALSAWHLNSPLRYLAFVLLLEWRLLRSQNFSHLNRYRYKMLRALQSVCFSTAQVAKYCSYQTSCFLQNHRTARWTPLQHGVSKWLQNSRSETAFALVKANCCKFDDGLLRCGHLCLEPSAIYPG